MDQNTYSSIIQRQRDFFASGVTKSYTYRKEQLMQLSKLLISNENAILDALHQDFKRHALEGYVSEIAIVLSDLKHAMHHLKNWMRPKKKSSLFPYCWPGQSYVYPEPYGVVLILGPWNFPFLLMLSPLIGAISAGNCIITKPSEIASHSQQLLHQLITDYFDPNVICSVQANPLQTQALLQEKFDYIFFTGGTAIGKHVMHAAAKHLTPITLELGGKSPCIIDDSANLAYATRRIMWAKFLNAGQICLAPDYIYIHESKKEAFTALAIETLQKFYGNHPEKSTSYPRIINQPHFKRLETFLQHGRILFGGSCHEPDLFISPTLIDHVTWQDPIMQEEIFGPILPIMTFKHIDDIIEPINTHGKPLACYLFSSCSANQKKMINDISFGGGAINDCIVHFTNPHLPFGGVGTSGMGAYHGEYSFNTFSHHKSIFNKRYPLDLPLNYPPYTPSKLKWLKRLLSL